MEFRVGVGEWRVRGQYAGVSELEFRVGVGEWNWRFPPRAVLYDII